MIIVWGSRMMGKVDVVPGLFHVATRFGHIYYLPLIPTGTYLVLSETGDSFHGARIPLSFKSIAFAWLRAAMLIVTVSTLLWAIMAIAEGRRGEWILPTVFAAAACATTWLVTWSKVCTRASALRAAQLAQQVGLNDAGIAHLFSIYGNQPNHGFDVVQPASHPTLTPETTRV